MKIQFKKGSETGTLTCIRSDGTATWTKLRPGIEIHDFAHFVVETELNFNDAFYGTVSKGFDIGDFELPGRQKPEEIMPANLSVQALQTEHLVNLLQVSFSEVMDLIPTLRQILDEKGIAFPDALDTATLDRIHTRLAILYTRWNDLTLGDTIELDF